MHEKPSATHSLGVVFEEGLLSAAILSHAQGKVTVERIFKGEGDVKPLYIQELADMQTENSEILPVTGLSASEVLVRPLEIKLTKESSINSVLPFQAEPLLPYPLDNAVIDKITISKDEQTTHLSLLSVRKDHLQAHLEKMEQVGIKPEVVTALPAALAAFAWQYSPVKSHLPLFVMHLGWDEITCVLSCEGKLLSAYAFSPGMKNIEGSFEDMRKSILKAYYAFSKQAKGREIPAILACGISADTIGKELCRDMNCDYLLPEDENLQQFAAPIGLALTALPKSGDQINFRQKDFAYPDPWKRYKKPLAAYLSLCCAVALCLFLLGQCWLAYKEDKLKGTYGELLQALNKTYDVVEAEYSKKNPLAVTLNDVSSGIALKKMSQQELMDRLYFLEKDLRSNPEIFPLQPNTARVSDVLAWLSTHANVATKADDGPRQPLIQIDSFNYLMVKRPELTKKQDKYQVKIELEFTSPTPKLAREFHDALIAPNDFVDPKSDIKWSATRGKYRTSFFLKDKTTYPSGAK